MTDAKIRPMVAADADAVLAINQGGLDGGNAGFEHAAPTWTAFDSSELAPHRFVATNNRGVSAR